jgi:hypothetical protein
MISFALGFGQQANKGVLPILTIIHEYIQNKIWTQTYNFTKNAFMVNKRTTTLKHFLMGRVRFKLLKSWFNF